jgi:hypothetical protein
VSEQVIYNVIISLYIDELHNLFSSPNVIRTIKSRNMWWAVHVARMGEKKNACRVFVGKPKERNHWEYLHIGGRIILK